MKIKKLADQIIVQLSQENAKKYDQATKTSYHEILGDELSMSLAEAFLATKRTFLVKDYGFEEQITSLTGSDFFNTLSYLEKLTCEEVADLFANQELEKLNDHFLFIFENGQETLFNAKNNLSGDNQLIEIDYQNLFIAYYQDYLELLCLRLPIYLSKILSIYQSLANYDDDPGFLMELLDDETFEFFNDLTFKATRILKGYLKQLYAKWPMDVVKMRKKNAFNKNAFADFATNVSPHDFNQIVIDNVEDALMVLDLAPGASVAEIKKAYHQLAKNFHPDLNPEDPERQAAIYLITTAYNFLKQFYQQ